MSIDRNTSLSFVIHVKTHGNYREYTTDSANVLTYVKIYVGEADSQIDRQNGFKGNSTDPNSQNYAEKYTHYWTTSCKLNKITDY